MTWKWKVSRKTKDVKCPRCGYEMGMASGGERDPMPGDFSICMECAAVNRWTEDMSIRAVPREEIPEYLYADVRKIQNAILAMRKKVVS